MYRIKQLPEDFVVKEILHLNLSKTGTYLYYLLKKRDYNTVDAVRLISQKFGISEKFINFAGTKDRHAVTEQYISINRGPEKGLEQKDLSLSYLGRGEERLNLGSLDGNEFEIVIRNIEPGTTPKKVGKIVNYFDEQRFGTNQDNHLVGKMLLKKDFKSAALKIAETNMDVSESLKRNPSDSVGALKSMHKKTLQMYVHAFQSFVWNKAAEAYLASQKVMPGENPIIPLPGFNTQEAGRGDERSDSPESIVAKILADEGISPRDFIIRQFPELTFDSGERPLFADVNNLKITDMEDDELNIGMKKFRASFFLGRGSYATLVIKALLNP
jgi:tRNA pseudouridine13 synthase